MADLDLDLGALDQVYKDLLSVSIEFDAIGTVNRTLTDAVGDDHLAGRVHDWANGWDDRREQIKLSLDALWKAVNSVHDTFELADTKLATNLTGEEG